MPPIEADLKVDNNHQSKPMSGPIIGIIYPPPEVRSILFFKAVFLFSVNTFNLLMTGFLH